MKLPFSFATRLVFRLVLPGLFLSTALVPVGGLLLDAATIHVDRGLVFTFCVIILEWLITLLDMPIYMLFEGRRFWPRWCWQFFYKREQKRLNRIEQKYEAARAEGNYRKAVEFEVERSYFPLSETDGTPTAM